METKMTRILLADDYKDPHSALVFLPGQAIWNAVIGYCVLPNCDISVIGL
jgi:hypothetical protein